MGDGFLLVTAAGDFFRLAWEPGSDTIKAKRLPVSVPFNRPDLLKASTAELAAPFRITDLLVDERSGAPRVYVAHHHWNSADNCVTLRVSSTTLPPNGASEAAAQTRPALSTKRPCGLRWPKLNGTAPPAMSSSRILP